MFLYCGNGSLNSIYTIEFFHVQLSLLLSREVVMMIQIKLEVITMEGLNGL